MNEVNISNALAEFVGAFEVVFRHDWEYTKIMIGDEATGANSEAGRKVIVHVWI